MKKAHIRFACINRRQQHIGRVAMICARPIAGMHNVPLFAPTQENLYYHRDGLLSDAEYVRLLKAKLRAKRKEIRASFRKFKDGQEYTYCCFCAPGKFCHRHTIFELFLELNEELGTGYTIDCF